MPQRARETYGESTNNIKPINQNNMSIFLANGVIDSSYTMYCASFVRFGCDLVIDFYLVTYAGYSSRDALPSDMVEHVLAHVC